MDETPGTYWWHGHAGVERVDGFYGPLIVRPNGPEALVYDEERTLLISDNFHGQANAMTFGLNRCAPSPGSVRSEFRASVSWHFTPVQMWLMHLKHSMLPSLVSECFKWLHDAGSRCHTALSAKFDFIFATQQLN